jgi:alpha-L-rhamnosidase
MPPNSLVLGWLPSEKQRNPPPVELPHVASEIMKTVRPRRNLAPALLMMVGALFGAVPFPGVGSQDAAGSFPDDPLGWPAATRECRPWTYNWWLGSALDTNNLAREIQRYRNAGLGGIHIIPIYGAKGAKARYIEYLSPRWMDMLRFTMQQADQQDMGVDMTTGTGWCFGGPNISERQGCTWRIAI